MTIQIKTQAPPTMPMNFLCFSDPSLSRSNDTSSCTIRGDYEHDNEDKSMPAAIAPTALFAREESKKPSFSLQRPYALVSDVYSEVLGDHPEECNEPKSTEVLSDADGSIGDLSAHIGEQERCNNIHAEDLTSTTTAAGKHMLFASASITSCCIYNERSHSLETFLFGGVDLIANAKAVEISVIRSENGNKEAGDNRDSYEHLMTCEGIPVQDLPPLETKPSYVNGRMPKVSLKNHGVNDSSHDSTALKGGEQDTFYKFIFVMQGGPKPVKRVRLKFLMINNTSNIARPIVVRALNVKGRLKGRLSNSITSNSTHQRPTSAQENGAADHATRANPGILQNCDEEANLGNLSSIMTQMGEDRAQLSQLHVRHQSEILSKIPGVNLFIRPFEELTTSKNEKMLSALETHIMDRLDGICDMEKRIMDRLDGIEKRLDGIERSLNETCISDEQNSSIEMEGRLSDTDVVPA